MTMASTRVPLDILFLDSRGNVLAVSGGIPGTREPYIAPPNSTMALEIQGGLAAKKGIAPGAVVSFRRM